MEKNIKTKHIRWLAAAVTLVVLVMLLLPYASAAKYTNAVANVNTALGEVPEGQVDNLLIDLMNRMYPVGSIYVTTSEGYDLSTPQKMHDHFGGTWLRFAQGQVPVGVYAGSDIEYLGWFGGTVGQPGGDPGGTAINTNIPVSLPVSDLANINSLGLSEGTAEVTGTGSAVTFTGGEVVLGGGDKDFTSEDAYITAERMPAHYHEGSPQSATDTRTGTLTVSRVDVNDGLSADTSYWRSDVGSGTKADVPKANVTVNEKGSGQKFNMTLRLNLNPGNAYGFKANFTAFSATFTTKFNYTPQELITATSNLTAATTVPLNTTDATVQPYITCYMYIRETLADLNP